MRAGCRSTPPPPPQKKKKKLHTEVKEGRLLRAFTHLLVKFKTSFRPGCRDCNIAVSIPTHLLGCCTCGAISCDTSLL